MDFKKLGEVDTVDEILDTDTVLVVRDGTVYRANKSQLESNKMETFYFKYADDDVDHEGNAYCMRSETDEVAVTYAEFKSAIERGPVLGWEYTVGTAGTFKYQQLLPSGGYLDDSAKVYSFSYDGDYLLCFSDSVVDDSSDA